MSFSGFDILVTRQKRSVKPDGGCLTQNILNISISKYPNNFWIFSLFKKNQFLIELLLGIMAALKLKLGPDKQINK
ncbi:hypothetical protein BpHYR1_051411 [Brachionus plicatilis]|uniref:Uncharacterized protein n=1 Tax=Brachionus plicatilis TaxID=10195 RepID=A0A3M7S2G1_BRAPC|nr:hypothetical protein BpHYR1_051411 [Brachionus plicatilis]